MRLFVFLLFALSIFLSDASLYGQTTVRKVRMGIQSTNIGFLPFHVDMALVEDAKNNWGGNKRK